MCDGFEGRSSNRLLVCRRLVRVLGAASILLVGVQVVSWASPGLLHVVSVVIRGCGGCRGGGGGWGEIQL